MIQLKYSKGDKIGRLTIIEFLGTDNANKRLIKCACECGKEIITRYNNVGRKTNSCGCLKADLIKKNMGKPIEHLCIVHVLNSCKRHTKDSNLTFKDVSNLIFNNCFYCELSPDEVGTTYYRAVRDGRSVNRVGIDRVDSSIGYYQSNVVSCCITCNRLKKDHSIDYLITKLGVMLKNLIKIKGSRYS